MAQASFTPISLYHTTTASAVPVNTNLVNGELAINITDGKLFYKDNANAVQVIGWKTTPISAGGTGATTAADARTNLGATTLGSNVFTISNPSAITFPRFNANNTVSALSAADFRTAIGAGTGGGTVTSVAFSGGTTGLTVSGSPITTSGTITLAGTLAVANGGTGRTTLTANNVLLGNGTGTVNFVAPGTSGNVLTSNGTTWTSAAPAGGGDPIGSLQYMAGLTSTTYPGSSYLKCDGSVVSQSTYSTLYARLGKIPDALNTFVTRSTTGTAGNGTGYVAFTNNLFITGENNGFRTSTDAITWTAVSSGLVVTSLSTGKAQGLVYGNGIYVNFRSFFVGKSTVFAPATSTNLITWTSRTFSDTSMSSANRIRYLNGQFLALGNDRLDGQGRLYSSTDGVTWTTRSIAGLASLTPTDIVFANSKYSMAVGNGTIYSSTDLVTWTSTNIAGSPQILGLAYYDSRYIAVPQSGARVFTSTDAVTWTVRSFIGGAGAIATDSADPQRVSVEYIPDSDTTVVFNSSSTGSRLIISNDTINWLTVSSFNTTFRPRISFGNSLLVVGGETNSNSIQRSAIYSYNIATNFALPNELNANNFGIFNSAVALSTLNLGGTQQQLYIKAL